ncbi:flagellar motor switch protein FliN [Microvirga terricola]|uniref:flagellar motor switch protein FliN n=1 Tax=Microvirga terricola TaxID=2719797 RepID=UPI00197B428C|nr:flagellar motor switch protein FliN [Microvirga terricola]
MTQKPQNGHEEQAQEQATWHNEALFSKTNPSGESGNNTRDDRIGSGRNLDSILRIPVLIQVVLGSATMPVANLMKLGRGAIVPLDHRVGEPVDVVVNGRVIARGEVVVVEDDNSRFGVSLTEIVGPPNSEFNS